MISEFFEEQKYETKKEADWERLIMEAIPFNEGREAVIKIIRKRELIGGFLKDVNLEDLEEDDFLIVKIAKRFSEGEFLEEFLNQKKAYDIVEKERRSGRNDLANISKPIDFKVLEIKNEEIKKKMGTDGISVKDNKVSVMLLGYAKGDDLATLLFREVIKRHPNLEGLVDHVDDFAFKDLANYVSKILEFFSPAGKQINLGVKEFEKHKVQSQNVKKIIDFLKRKGYVLNPVILEKIKNTVKLLHENGFYHGDLHERNVIICCDGQYVSIIDFGNHSEADETERNLDDNMIPNLYHELTISIDEERSAVRHEIKKQLTELVSKIEVDDSWLTFKKNFENYKTPESVAEDIQSLADKIGGFGDLYWNILGAALLEFSSYNKELALKTIDFIRESYITRYKNQKIKKDSMPAFASNILAKLKDII